MDTFEWVSIIVAITTLLLQAIETFKKTKEH